MQTKSTQALLLEYSKSDDFFVLCELFNRSKKIYLKTRAGFDRFIALIKKEQDGVMDQIEAVYPNLPLLVSTLSEEELEEKHRYAQDLDI